MGATFSARQAATYCGVTETSVRRWIASGRLPAALEDGVFRIREEDLLPFHDRHKAQVATGDAPVADTSQQGAPPSATQGAPSLDSLVALIERQQQTIMELSGRLGFYQAKLQDAEARILELEAPKEAPAETANHLASSENGSNLASQKVSPRPWWQFWR